MDDIELMPAGSSSAPEDEGQQDAYEDEDMWTHPSFQLYRLHPRNDVKKNRMKTALLFFVVGSFFAACLAFFYSQEKHTTIVQDIDKVVARPFTLEGVDIQCQPLTEFNRAMEDSPRLHGIRGTLQVVGKFATKEECKAAATATILQNLRWSYDDRVHNSGSCGNYCPRDMDSHCLNQFGCSLTDFPRGQSCFALKATESLVVGDDSTTRPYLSYRKTFRRGDMPAETWWNAVQMLMAAMDPTLPYMKDWVWGSATDRSELKNAWAEWEAFKAFMAANRNYTMATYFGEGKLTEACTDRYGSRDQRCGDIQLYFGALMPYFSDKGELLGFNGSSVYGSDFGMHSKSWEGGLDTSVPHPNLPKLPIRTVSGRRSHGCVGPFFNVEMMTWLNETFQVPVPPFITQMRALSHTFAQGLLEEEVCADFEERVSPYHCTYQKTTVITDSKSFWESVSLSLSASASVFTVVVFLIHKFWH